MKRVLLVFLCFILLLILALPCAAHPGSLDSNGGHYNHATGEYHYHDGTHTSGPSSGSSSSGSHRGNTSGFFETLGNVVAVIIFLGFIAIIVWPLVAPLFDTKHSTSAPPPSTRPSDENDLGKEKTTPPTEPTKPPYTSSTREYHEPRAPYMQSPPSDIVPALHPKPLPKEKKPEPIQVPPPPRHPLYADYPYILNIDFSFLPKRLAESYISSLQTERAVRAVSEKFTFDRINIDATITPHTAEGVITSKSGNTYYPTLRSCTCPDSKIRHMVCKHMLALARETEAITIDVRKLKSARQFNSNQK